eukprot:TRINITY_DN7480_c0_g1_i6.p1 TRINITY_DN7480_c0_g1~~TRINITY_DN7480_c0_g1_i6.p1  ORF type:complete len:433 (+),score=45.44 TRINITY_DN7480_c0_g1_i6:69-1367(+)
MENGSLKDKLKLFMQKLTKSRILYFLATALTGFILCPQLFAKIRLRYNENSAAAKRRLAKMPSLLKGVWRPTFWLPYGDMQTVFVSAYKYKGPPLKMQEEIIRCNEHGDLWIDWVRYQDGAKAEKARTPAKDDTIIVVIPGLTGDRETEYVQDVSNVALTRGYSRVVIAHYRWSNPKLAIPQKGYINYVEDFERIIKHIKKTQNPKNILVVGHSFGGNLIINFLGTKNDEKLVTAGVSVSNPFNLMLASSQIHSGIYCKFLTRSLIRAFTKHQEEVSHFSKRFNLSWEEITQAKSLREFDDRFTKRLTGYPSGEAYYKAVSSAQNLHKTNVPTLILSAVDDRFVHEDCLPYDEIKHNENIILAMTDRGGHVGWFEGVIPRRWFPTPVMEFFDAIWEEQSQKVDLTQEVRSAKAKVLQVVITRFHYVMCIRVP